ncbi:hypothetical protein BDF19DRAFT_462355 [Syncephalis fuscata]|nr:hypothetical protein BDF19DRAFT_462355 [Syncephalis fuscata]
MVRLNGDQERGMPLLSVGFLKSSPKTIMELTEAGIQALSSYAEGKQDSNLSWGQLRVEIRNGINNNVTLLTTMAIEQESIKSRRNLRSVDKPIEEIQGERKNNELNDLYNDESTPPATAALFQMDSPIYAEDIADEIEEMIIPIRQVVMDCLDNNFESGPPFTIQRLAELVLKPTEHYNEPDKYLRAVQRMVMVTSTPFDYPPVSTENGTGQLVEMDVPTTVVHAIHEDTPLTEETASMSQDSNSSDIVKDEPIT